MIPKPVNMEKNNSGNPILAAQAVISG